MKFIFILLVFILTFFLPSNVYCQFALNSFPSAAATIYLDFDGQIVNNEMWNGGNTITCAHALLSVSQIAEVFNRVSEDYRPFDINVTTSEAVFLAAPLEKRIRVIITTTSDWYSLVGGVAFVGSFTWGDDTPCFVFSKNLGNVVKTIAECCSHESGHTLGLYHQSTYDASCNLTLALNEGIGSGETGWAPIMGNSYNRNMSGWNNGPTPIDCNFLQDNLSTIASYNGFSYRVDDFEDDINIATTVINSKYININGIIGTTNDKDAFKFTLSNNAAIHLDIRPYSVGLKNDGSDLDIKVELYNNLKVLLRTYSPPNTMNVTIDTLLMSGNYFLVISGSENINISNYGSLGSYQVVGSEVVVLPIHTVTLSGKVDNGKHKLNWDIISDELIKSIVVETSEEGVVFKNNNVLSPSTSSCVFTPADKKNIYYRLKVESLYGQVVYSNIIVLKTSNKTENIFTIVNILRNNVLINAPANYTYQLINIDGRVLAKGKGIQGYNNLNIDQQTKGIYILQLITSSERQVERIFVQ